MKNTLSVSLIQAPIILEKKETNLSNFFSLINQIKSTDIILLPEMFNTGFCIESAHLAESMNGKTIKWMKNIVRRKQCAIAGTLMIIENNKVYNRLIWISKNEKIFKYDKRHLFSLMNEDKYLNAGKERLIVNENGWNICPLICYDLRFPVFSRNNVDYDLLIFLANWPSKRIHAWDTLLKARSIENQCITIGLNRTSEPNDQIEYNGHSAVYDNFGNKIFYAGETKEKVETIILNKDSITKQRKKLNFLKDRDEFIIL